jgi:cyclopropane-fatty-acyl-phospholipid synthase
MRSDLISKTHQSRPRQQVPRAVESQAGGAAGAVTPLLSHFLGGPPPVRVQFWDGTSLGPDNGDTLQVSSPDAVRRILWSPGELGLARAFVTGDLTFKGDIFQMLAVLHAAFPSRVRRGTRLPWQALRAAQRLGALGRPIPPPPEEAAPRGRLHSRTRDAQAVRHHYDVGNDFYAMVLGPTMTYSCARIAPGADTLEAAQDSKHDLICRKLGLPDRTGQRILDVGCGWGSFAIHAARHYGARVVGVTLSPAQAESARERVAASGFERQVEIVSGGGGIRTVEERFAEVHVNGIISNLPAISVGRRGTRWHSLAHTGTRSFAAPVSHSCPTEVGHSDPVFLEEKRVLEGVPVRHHGDSPGSRRFALQNQHTRGI